MAEQEKQLIDNKISTKLSIDELNVLRNSLINQEDTKIALANQRGLQNIKLIQDIDQLINKVTNENKK